MTRAEITEFYREHNRRLFNTALRILGDSGEAEEVMQDTILKFLSAEGTFAGEAQVRAWLTRTCIRGAIDRLRERRRRRAFLEEYAAGAETVEEGDFSTALRFARNDRGNVAAGEEDYGEEGVPGMPGVREIWEAMMAMEEPYRVVLALVLIEGLDYGEIARITGKKETTLRSLYSRGRAKLARMLKAEMI
jgi:RNA polymerase sigma-70 factor (ECF subfamily)